MTLVEMSISLAIFAMMIGVVMTLFLFVVREERSNIMRIRMAYDAADLHRELRRYAAVGGVNNTVVDPNNISVSFTNADTGISSRLEFVDPDGDPDSMRDNLIRLIPDLDEPDKDVNVVRFATPLIDPDDPSERLPIFSRAGSFNQALLVNFRIGDRRGDLTERTARGADDECRAEDAITGKGFQSILFRGAYGPRNR